MEKLKILFSASECVPYAKTGGLADVVGTLPKYLKKLGHDVRVVMPRYYNVDRSKLKKLDEPLGVPMGIIGELWCGVFEGFLPDSDVPVYFIDYERYYGRESLYNDENGEGFLDNDNRFIFLSKASLQLCKMIGFTPDVVNTHDWHTASANIFLNTIYRYDEHLKDSASVLTIHNMQHQGNFYPGVMDVLGIGWEYYHRGIEKDKQANLLKGGIYHSTLFNTVSQGYANEMRTKEYGCGLEGVIIDRWDSFRGILNGMDYDEWNPKTDKYLKANYDENDLKGKQVCKEDIQEYFGLEKRDVPIIGVVTRLVNQKGVDVLAEAIHRIMSLDVQFVLLGSGEPWSHFYFGGLNETYRGRYGCKIGYDNELAHKIEAGSDFFLMPSRFEPCGLNQMYSLRYGTLPIVRATGGLDDTVENYDEDGGGDGFKFHLLDASSLFNTVGWATWAYYNKQDDIKKMKKRAMEKRFSWENSAKEYEKMYLDAIDKKRG
ncbi:MAG: glycogen synthase [Campylobacterales bacterium]